MAVLSAGSVESARRVPVWGLVLIVLGVIVALFVVDTLLENAETASVKAQARNDYNRGTEALKAGDVAQALDLLRKAHALDRRNSGYALRLAEAFQREGKLQEAEALVSEVLGTSPNDGYANLVAARLAGSAGRVADADAYYHRAIYGIWPDKSSSRSFGVRLELIHYLTTHGRNNELLAELLPLQSQAANDLDIQAQLAPLFLKAGSPYRAAEIYHILIHRDPHQQSFYLGLGQAELELGNYRAASHEFSQALQRGPDDTVAKRQLGVAQTLSSIDPTPRQLSAPEKLVRSLEILKLAQNDLQTCLRAAPQPATSEAEELVTAADVTIAAKRKQQTNEAAEAVLGEAQRIWQTRVKLCGSATGDAGLRLMMEKLGS